MSAATGLLLAHQGGWDEALFVLAPLLLFAGLLMVARRRVDHMESSDHDMESGDPGMESGDEPADGHADDDAGQERAGGR